MIDSPSKEIKQESSLQAKESFQKDLELRLDQLESEILKLREKGEALKDDAQVQWDARLTELESKRKSVRAKLTEVGHSTSEAWQDVKIGAQAAWNELDKAFHEAKAEF